jgi:hypothetical protein
MSSCNDKTIKQWQLECKKKKLPYCGSFKRKADLCDYVKSGKSSSFKSSKCDAWLKKDLLKFCRNAKILCDLKLTKSEICKMLSQHFRRESVAPLPPVLTGLPKTFQEFQAKSCNIPRQGWLVDELKEIAKTLGISHSHKRKDELCRMISEYFTKQSRSPGPKSPAKRVSMSPRPKSPANIHKQPKTIENMAPDISRYIGGMLPLKDVLSMCESSNVLAKKICNQKVFWRNYYNNKLESLQTETIWSDLEFLQLVILKTHKDLLKKLKKGGKKKIYVILNIPNDDDNFVYVPINIPVEMKREEEKNKRKKSLPRKHYNKSTKDDEVTRFKKKLLKELKTSIPQIDVFFEYSIPYFVGDNNSLIRKLKIIIDYL